MWILSVRFVTIEITINIVTDDFQLDLVDQLDLEKKRKIEIRLTQLATTNTELVKNILFMNDHESAW